MCITEKILKMLPLQKVSCLKTCESMDCMAWLKFFYRINNNLSLQGCGLKKNQNKPQHKPWRFTLECGFTFRTWFLSGTIKHIESDFGFWVEESNLPWEVWLVCHDTRNVLFWCAEIQHFKEWFMPILGGFCLRRFLFSLLCLFSWENSLVI